MRYLIMECHSAYAVALDDDGRFLKVANMHYQVGQTVTQVEQMVLPEARPDRRWLRSLSTLAACMVLVFAGWFLNFRPYASVYIAINPQVRIDVSRRDQVLKVTGVNADGETLLTGYEAGRKALDVVMDELVDRAIDMGYLHEGGKVTVTLDGDQKWVADHETDLNTHLTEHLHDKIAVTVDVGHPAWEEETQPVQSTAASQTVVIPMAPEGGYGESDYDDPEEGRTPYDDDSYDLEDGQTDYGIQDSGYDRERVSPYDLPGADKDAPPDREKDSGYDPPDKDSGYDAPDKDSGYDAPKAPAKGADSGYDPPPKTPVRGGSSGYGGSDYDD